MGERAFELGGYSVESRKAATDDGSRSTAEAEVLVGGEVLRGTATGFGPVDALSAALRAALVPLLPEVADVSLVDFASALVEARGDGRSAVRVTVSARLGERSWTAEGVAGDLLHASWLAVGNAYAGLDAAAPAPAAARGEYPSVSKLAGVLCGPLNEDDKAVLDRVASTDWSTGALDLDDAADRWFAASALSLGATVVSAFGNQRAAVAHPQIESIHRVNLQTGRPVNQVGSITSTRPRLDRLFDWEQLPAGLTQEQVLALMDAFFELGPMGFRGPAARSVTAQLTSYDGEVKTTLLVGPGYGCPSNELLDKALGFIDWDYVFATAAPVDIAGEEGVVVIGHAGQAASHQPMAVPVLAFHKLVEGALVLERHGSGSLDVAEVERIVGEHGLSMRVA